MTSDYVIFGIILAVYGFVWSVTYLLLKRWLNPPIPGVHLKLDGRIEELEWRQAQLGERLSKFIRDQSIAKARAVAEMNRESIDDELVASARAKLAEAAQTPSVSTSPDVITDDSIIKRRTLREKFTRRNN